MTADLVPPRSLFEDLLGQPRAVDLLAAARQWLPQPQLSLVGPAEAIRTAEQAWQRHPLSRSGR